MLYSRRTSQKHWCNVQLADKVMLISIISLKVIFAHAPVLSNLIHKTCAVTLTGKRPPNRDLELQRTELVQDTKTLMVQDTKVSTARVWDSQDFVDLWTCLKSRHEAKAEVSPKSCE